MIITYSYSWTFNLTKVTNYNNEIISIDKNRVTIEACAKEYT